MKICSLDQESILKAENYLSRRDKRLAMLIKRHGPCNVGIESRNKLDVLITSIVSQQLSGKAASTIRARLIEMVGRRTSLASAIVKFDVDELRSCGLSLAKAETILRVARLVVERELNFTSLMKLSDEDVLEELTAIKGIGGWTAQMFLIFALHRPDVFSVADAGLRRGLQLLYDFEDRPTEEQMLAITEKWRPYRTVGSWYLWRLLD